MYYYDLVVTEVCHLVGFFGQQSRCSPLPQLQRLHTVGLSGQASRCFPLLMEQCLHTTRLVGLSGQASRCSSTLMEQCLHTTRLVGLSCSPFLAMQPVHDPLFSGHPITCFLQSWVLHSVQQYLLPYKSVQSKSSSSQSNLLLGPRPASLAAIFRHLRHLLGNRQW